MMKVMCNEQWVYKVVIWASFGINVWKEKVAITSHCHFVKEIQLVDVLQLTSEPDNTLRSNNLYTNIFTICYNSNCSP